MKTINDLIKENRIIIVSGEGISGSYTEYKGKRTMRAINTYLKKERCNGDRWAYAKVYSHNNGEPIFVDVHSGEYWSPTPNMVM